MTHPNTNSISLQIKEEKFTQELEKRCRHFIREASIAMCLHERPDNENTIEPFLTRPDHLAILESLYPSIGEFYVVLAQKSC